MQDHISASQIGMFGRCGVQYYYRYIEGLIIPPSSAMVVGSSFHKGEEVNFKQKIKTKRDLPVDDVKDAFNDHYKEASKEILWKSAEKEKGVKAVTEELRASGMKTLEYYHTTRAIEMQPVKSEWKFTVSLGDGYPEFLGFVDVITENGTGENIVDMKFSGKSPNQGDAEKSLQLTAYAMGYRTVTGKSEAGLMLDYAVSTKQPKVVTLETQREQRQIDNLMNRIEVICKAIKQGIFTPADAGSWVCSPAWCGYWDLCKYKP